MSLSVILSSCASLRARVLFALQRRMRGAASLARPSSCVAARRLCPPRVASARRSASARCTLVSIAVHSGSPYREHAYARRRCRALLSRALTYRVLHVARWDWARGSTPVEGRRYNSALI
jgi:hypothetical protein